MDALAALSSSALPAIVLAGIVGLVVGSFLNVVIHRLPIMMQRAWAAECAGPDAPAPVQPRYNLVVPRSACPACAAPIAAGENIPLVSYLLLRGRCRHCRSAISPRYPLVEAGTALASALVAARFGLGTSGLAALAITWLLIAAAVIDLDHQLLPDSLTLPLLWAGLLASLVIGPGPAGFPVTPAEAIAGAAAGYLSLWSVYHLFRLLTGKEGMGYGDFKLYAAFGAWLGWRMLIPLILIAASSGAVLGVTLILLHRHGRGVPLPFGPFLAIAGWLILMWPGALVAPWWPLTR